MERAIFQKEWVKTSKIFILCLIVAAAMAVYAVMRMNRLIELKGAEHLWLIMLLKDNSFVEVVKWVPLFASLAIALGQMVPEMSQKRLKLTLHLPYPQSRMILLMLAAGVAELLVIFAVQTAIIGIYDARILPGRLVGRVLLTMMPWYFAGLTAYLFTAAVCIEGRRLRRIALALVGVSFVAVFYEQSAMAAYAGMTAWILMFLVIVVTLPLGAVLRFKEGLQD